MFNSKLDTFLLVREVIVLKSSNIDVTISSTALILESTKQENDTVVLAV